MIQEVFLIFGFVSYVLAEKTFCCQGDHYNISFTQHQLSNYLDILQLFLLIRRNVLSLRKLVVFLAWTSAQNIMGNRKRRSNRKAFQLWFIKRRSRADASDISGKDEQDDESIDGLFVRSLEAEPCIQNNEVRIFVGTWNVAGRSPMGSLAVDLDEWFNLKDAADIYVLGFQEIVPLKAATVIGAEDPTEAANWNSLIGKTLNSKYGGAWLTPMINPIVNDNYHYDGATEPDGRLRSDYGIETAATGQPGTKYEISDRTGTYKLMASKKMVGVLISVWMRRALLKKYCVSEVKVSSVACGIMGYLGNKGSVSVSMSIEGTSFCFVAAHLASGEKKGDEGKRNHQVTEIFRRTSFPRIPEDHNKYQPLTILGHDQIFWFGDLNYRLYLEDNLARELIKKQNWSALQEFDQLQKELEDGGVFQGWKEGNIEFAPTYKYSSYNGNRYSGGLPSRAGEKQRTPAWCDRILWYGKGVKQLSYLRSESKFSDHRPVSALFSTVIEVQKGSHSSLVPVPPPVPSAITSKTARGKGSRDTRSLLFSLIVGDIERSTRHVQMGKSSRWLPIQLN